MVVKLELTKWEGMGRPSRNQANEQKNLSILVFQSRENRADAREERESILCAFSDPNDHCGQLDKERNYLRVITLRAIISVATFVRRHTKAWETRRK